MIVALQLGLSLVLGGLIGLERELTKNTAGLRTHMLVCMSSCLLIVISKDVAKDMGVIGDPMRVAAGVITGIGFLGAGTIIKHGATVRGLTTAASIWTAAAVGMAVGADYYEAAIIVVLLTLFTLYFVHYVDERLRLLKRRSNMLLTLDYHPGVIDEIDTRFDELGLDIGEFSVSRKMGKEGQMVIEARIRDTGDSDRSEIAEFLMEHEAVVGVDFF